MSTKQPVENTTFGPYEAIRRAGDWYFVSGQVGVDPTTGQTGETIAAQTQQVLHNLSGVLAGAGLDLQDVVKTTVYLTDMAEFAAMNDVYVRYFDAPRPARATVGIKELPRVGGSAALKVEIEAVAMKGGRE